MGWGGASSWGLLSGDAADESGAGVAGDVELVDPEQPEEDGGAGDRDLDGDGMPAVLEPDGAGEVGGVQVGAGGLHGTVWVGDRGSAADRVGQVDDLSGGAGGFFGGAVGLLESADLGGAVDDEAEHR